MTPESSHHAFIASIYFKGLVRLEAKAKLALADLLIQSAFEEIPEPQKPKHAQTAFGTWDAGDADAFIRMLEEEKYGPRQSESK